MHISDRMRDAIYEHADRGFAVLHIPKAAGTSIRLGLRERMPVVELPYLAGPHEPGCRCKGSSCVSRRRMERKFISRLEGRRPWCLWLGHLRLSTDELADIPEGMPVVVPLRPTADRFVSYFRYYWTMADAARHRRFLITARHELTWCLRRGIELGTIPRFSRQPRDVRSVSRFRELPPTYLHHDGRTIDAPAWAADALGESAAPFLYRDFLPEDLLGGAYSVRLRCATVDALGNWLQKDFGVVHKPRNVSRHSVSMADLSSAMPAIMDAALVVAARDEEVWSRLMSQGDRSGFALDRHPLPESTR